MLFNSLYYDNNKFLFCRVKVILDEDKMLDLVRRRRINQADWILGELIDRNCSFGEFCFMLRQFDLLEELALLVPVGEFYWNSQPILYMAE